MYLRSLQDVVQSIVRVEGVRKVIYPRVADVNYTRGVRESIGSPIEAPTVEFRDNLLFYTCFIWQPICILSDKVKAYL